jgi:hypothetical protein
MNLNRHLYDKSSGYVQNFENLFSDEELVVQDSLTTEIIDRLSKMENKLADAIKYLKNASILDYVREGLDKAIWDVEGETVRLRSDIKAEIEDIVYSALDDLNLSPEALEGLYIYGSILSNQWNPKTDIDARIVLDPEFVSNVYPDITGDDLFDMVVEKIHGIPLGNTKHPFNATIIVEGEETELGKSELGRTEENSVYNVLRDEVIVPPHFQEDFDPDVEFEQERDETSEIMDRLDKLLQETRADSIDYEMIEEAIGDVKDPDLLMMRLEEKLEQIELDIADLIEEYERIKKERTESYAEGEGHSGPGNIRFKYLERYKYLDVLRKLKRLFKEGIEPGEVEEVIETVT